MATSMDDIRVEKAIETVYDMILAEIPKQKLKTCPILIRLGAVLHTMKKENNDRIAEDMGIVGDCEGCGKRCK